MNTNPSQPIAYCAICGKGLHAGDLMCNHTGLETARYKRDGCACGGEHVAELVIDNTALEREQAGRTMGDVPKTAEILRQAAALMRERAEAATEGPWAWEAVGEMDNGWCLGVVWDDSDQPLTGRVEAGCGEVVDSVCENVGANHFYDAEHIASWHPLVALAVAEWLDAAGADLWAHGPLCECGGSCERCDDSLWEPHARRALAVARAYLGSDR